MKISIPEFMNKSAVMRRIGVSNRGNFFKYIKGTEDIPDKHLQKWIEEGRKMQKELAKFQAEIEALQN